MTTTEASAQILLKAAQLIDAHGLSKGAHWNPRTGSYCALGAMTAAAFGVQQSTKRTDIYEDEARLAAFHDARLSLALSIDGAYGDVPWIRVVAWNDEDGRTAADVASMMRRAAR